LRHVQRAQSQNLFASHFAGDAIGWLSSTTTPPMKLTAETPEVIDLRKTAARLAAKAVAGCTAHERKHASEKAVWYVNRANEILRFNEAKIRNLSA
jgi:hypothetical protein